MTSPGGSKRTPGLVRTCFLATRSISASPAPSPQCAGSAHLAGDRFRLWTGRGAHERLGDDSLAHSKLSSRGMLSP
jgi:hypothetical protein